MSEEKLTEKERSFLLSYARRTIGRELGVDDFDPATDADIENIGPHLKEKRGCFVTVHRSGQLRGCIGIFESRGPLWKNVEEMAIQAAFHDPRFPPLAEREYEKIDIEISVLSPLRKIDNVDEIKIGKHGIYITRSFNRGVLLPQVATEQGWDRDTFLDHTCLKAGLSPGSWRKAGTVIEVFTAEVFGEKESCSPNGCSSIC